MQKYVVLAWYLFSKQENTMVIWLIMVISVGLVENVIY